MRILYINVNCQDGSTGKIVFDLYTHSRAADHQAAVCYGRGPLVQGEHIFKFGLDWETYLHALLTRITGWTGCFSHFSTKRLLRFIDEFRPDVVHIHELHAYFVNLRPLLQYLAEQKIPVVQTLHCEFTYTGKCGYAYECERWKKGCGNCPKVHGYPKSLFFDFTALMFRKKRRWISALPRLTVAAPSRWLADRAKQSFLSERDVHVIHNGINTTEIFHPRDVTYLRKRHGLRDEKVVLSVAPDLMEERKGGRWVLKLAETLARENIRFILIGVKNPDEVFPPNVIALGRTGDQTELAAYYSLADCFVICSERENFPTTCLEAFCCGAPVAGFRAGGTAETVPQPYGRFCEYGDIERLAGLVKEQLINGRSTEISQRGAELYSSKQMYDAYQKIYRELVK